MRYDRGGYAAIAVVVTLAVSGQRAALAQTPATLPSAAPSGKVVAEALFEEGRKLVADGKYSDACPKFADSQRLDPSASTLLNLASCYEKLGRSATAWATYKEAASVANAAGRAEYVAAAQRHADALTARLSRLTITVAGSLEGIRVERDGVAIDSAEWGTPIPVDPGEHTVSASAPGHQSWASTVDMTQGSTQVTIAVPPLEPLPGEPSSPPPPLAPAAVEAPSAPGAPGAPSTPGAARSREGSSTSGVAVGGWVIAGLGVAVAGVGAGFAIAAKRRYDASLDNCQTGANRNLCYPQGVADRNDARTDGDIATWTIAGGAAALAAGVVMVLAAPRSVGRSPRDRAPRASWVVVPWLGGAGVQGSW
jgi:hypothetical protein